MNKYKGLFTFDLENHRYLPLEQADGILCIEKYYHEEPKEPLIKDEKVRKAVRAWADFNGTYPIYREDRCTLSYDHGPRIEFKALVFADSDYRAHTINELCGED